MRVGTAEPQALGVTEMNPRVRKLLFAAFVVVASLYTLAGVAYFAFVYVLGNPGFVAFYGGAVRVQRVDLRDSSNRTLWSIESPEPREVYFLRYGTTPRGFRERVKPTRPIREDEPLLLIINFGPRWTRHLGNGGSRNAFRGGGYLSGESSRTPPSRVFDETATIIDTEVPGGSR